MIKIIKKNKIQVIYIAGTLDNRHIYNYIDKQCFNEIKIFENLKSYELKNCNDINNTSRTPTSPDPTAPTLA